MIYNVVLVSCVQKNDLVIYTYIYLGFPGGSAGKEPTCNVGDLGSIPRLGRSPGDGNSYPLQCTGLENFMDCIVPGVAKSWTQLIDFDFTSYIYLGSPDGVSGKEPSAGDI